uniref:Uncharacterized protein n=1 Tax=viral metagenome TaxID=1070528 RepID=A0A6C0JQK3_9ZZZZ
MTDITKTVQDYVDVIRDIDLEFINTCAVAGGFNLPKQEVLKHLKIDSIFNRLFEIADNNLVFASEMGEGKPEYNNVKFTQANNAKIRGLELIHVPDSSAINDTCVLTSSMFIGEALGINSGKYTVEPGKGRYKLVPIDDHGNLIASIHLSGDGPAGDKEKEPKTIANFIKSHLPNDKNICMFCGDTNITTLKTPGEPSRQEIGKQIASALHKLNDNEWVVFMSDLKVDKMRSGFVLYNQQLKKSTYPEEGKDSSEADGTIFAIKISHQSAIDGILADIPSHYSCYTKDGTVKKSTVESIEPIYTFSGDNSLDSNGQVIEKIFLDHSVLQLSADKCNTLLSPIILPTDIKNVIVLNMGSIANSGQKNWNTNNIDSYDEIVKADKALYDVLKVHESKLPEFDKIVGSKFLKEHPNAKPGVDKVKITVSQSDYENMKSKFTAIIESLKHKINRNSGGKRISKRQMRHRSKSRSKKMKNL